LKLSLPAPGTKWRRRWCSVLTGMEGKRVLRGQACVGPRARGPQPGARARAGLVQRAGSGRTGLGQERPAGEGRVECVIVNPRRELCRSNAQLGWKIGWGGAAQAVAAARKYRAVLMLVMG